MGESPDPGSLDNFWRSAENFHQQSSEGMWPGAEPNFQVELFFNITLNTVYTSHIKSYQ